MSIKLLGRFRDEDGAEKFVYQNQRGVIELTWIKKPHKNANIFCLPTHYYCNLGCKFCHLTTESTNKEIMRPISSEELLEAFLDVWNKFVDFKPALLFSFMGVGEPFLNYRLVADFYVSLKNRIEFKKPESINLALATMIPDLYPFQFFADEVVKNHLPLKIHFSMHSPISSIRKSIIPCTNVDVKRACLELVKYRELMASIGPVMKEFSKYHNLADASEIHYTVLKT